MKDETVQGGDNDRELLNVRLTYKIGSKDTSFFFLFCLFNDCYLLYLVPCYMTYFVMNYY